MSVKRDIRPVRVLPEDVANKIAAGEVVERPGSVVKELLENALDAGASRIIVRLVAAGRRTIEIIDNGHGMSEQDALLAIERHATSKIRKAEDIDNVVTMGFRGEALPSIASVSRFELVTRRADDQHATRIRIEGGVLRDVSQTSAPRTAHASNRYHTPVREVSEGTHRTTSIDIVSATLWSGRRVQISKREALSISPENTTTRPHAAYMGLGFGMTCRLRRRGGPIRANRNALPGPLRAHASVFFLQRPAHRQPKPAVRVRGGVPWPPDRGTAARGHCHGNGPAASR